MQRWPGCHQRWSRSVPGVFKGTSLWLELKGKKWGSRKWNQRGNEWAASSCYFVSLQLLCWEWPIWEQRWKKGPYKRPWQYSNQGMMVAVRGEKDWVQLCTADGIFWWIRETKSSGTPLQYSCLENPMDGGAWWAAVYGVSQSQTQLKRLNSSGRETKRESVGLSSRKDFSCCYWEGWR